MTDRSVKSYDGRFRRRWRLAITLLVLGLVGAAITWQTERVTKSVTLTELREAGTRQINLHAGSLRGALEKHASLPFILSRNKDIFALLRGPEDTALQESVNLNLEETNAATGSGWRSLR